MNNLDSAPDLVAAILTTVTTLEGSPRATLRAAFDRLITMERAAIRAERQAQYARAEYTAFKAEVEAGYRDAFGR